MAKRPPLLATAGACIFCLGATVALAQNTVVTGTVNTVDGVPVQGYPVIISNKNSRTVAITDSKGNFEAYDLAPGEYSATASSDTDQNVTFTVPEGKKTWSKLWQQSQERLDVGKFSLSPLNESRTRNIRRD